VHRAQKQQRMQQHQTAPRLQIGQEVDSAQYFGDQPTRPTTDNLEQWEEVFGPHGPMINYFSPHRARVQSVPIGFKILYDRKNRWAWKPNCGNPVILAPDAGPPPPQRQQPQPVFVQQPQQRQTIICPPPPPVVRQVQCPPQVQQVQQRRPIIQATICWPVQPPRPAPRGNCPPWAIPQQDGRYIPVGMR
jgi:hypothetical protein